MTRSEKELAEAVAWTVTFSMLAYGAAMIGASVYYATENIRETSENVQDTEDPLQRLVGSWFD